MGAVVDGCIQGPVEVVGPAGLFRLVGLLSVVGGPREVAIEPAGEELLARHRQVGRAADQQLASRMLGGVDDRLAATSGWKIGGTGWRLLRQRDCAPSRTAAC